MPTRPSVSLEELLLSSSKSGSSSEWLDREFVDKISLYTAAELRSFLARTKSKSIPGKVKKADLVESVKCWVSSASHDELELVCSETGREKSSSRFALDRDDPPKVLPLKEWLLQATNLTDRVLSALERALLKLTVAELQCLAKDLRFRLTNASKKGEIVARVLAVSRIGSHDRSSASLSAGRS